MAVDFPDPGSLRVTRTFEAPVRRVWAAFITPRDMAAWMWASYAKNATAEADVRVGGQYRVYTDAPVSDDWASAERGRVGFLGLYVDVAEHSRLVYTLHWDANVGYNSGEAIVADEVVRVDFTADGDRTIVSMHHMGVPDDGISARTHAEGIEAMFDDLARLVEGEAS